MDAGGLAPAVANGLWYLLCLPDALAFGRATRDVAGTQRRLLLRLLRRSAGTEYGRRHDFDRIRSVAEYQARVPLTEYEDYQEGIERIGAGAPRVLTHDRVRRLERTSGSTAASKLIPYTAALQREFGRAIAPWIVDLFDHDPRLLLGTAYWSVTPVTRRDERRAARTPGGLPVGFEEDSEYFGFWQRILVRSIQAVPPLVRLIDDVDAFRYVTLLFLLRRRSLALISVWNPTFLALLVEPLGEWWPALTADVAAGTLSPPAPLAPGLTARLRALNRPDPRRAVEVRQAFEAGGGPAAIHARLWPELRLISCWMDAEAARYAPELARLFPQARLQGKGLLATEGVVSFPLADLTPWPRLERQEDRTPWPPLPAGQGGRQPAFDQIAGQASANGPEVGSAAELAGAALAIRSHFFEFLPADERGGLATGATDAADASDAPRPCLAHELERDACYSVVLTTAGGFYRYRLHDVVQVTGHLRGCPLLRFVGKEALVADHFGEKLNERHVRRALDAALRRYAVRPAFAMVACEAFDDPAARRHPRHAYTLFVEAPEPADAVVRCLARELEAALQENFHYRYCRDLGQLGALRGFRIDGGAQAAYLAACRAHGQRAGDVKSVALHHRRGWSQVFRGRLL